MALTVLVPSERPGNLRKRAGARSFLNWIVAALGAILFFSFTSGVSVAQINYGSFTGATVDFIDVTETSTSGDSLPLFGVPVFTADSLDFNPVGFDANASGGAGMDN